MTNPYAVGRSIYLKAPTAEEAEGRWYEWFSDPETTQYLAQRYWPNTAEQQKEFVESLQRSTSSLVLSVIDKETDQHVGVCSLGAISWLHRYSDIAVVIGEPKYRNGQVALEVVSLLLEVAFLRLNLRNVKGAFLAPNRLSQSIHKIFGFEEVGRFKELCFYNGGYVDLVSVQLHRDKWLQRNREKVPPTL